MDKKNDGSYETRVGQVGARLPCHNPLVSFGATQELADMTQMLGKYLKHHIFGDQVCS